MICAFCGQAVHESYTAGGERESHLHCVDMMRRRRATGICIACGRREATGYCGECVRAGMIYVGYGGGAA